MQIEKQVRSGDVFVALDVIRTERVYDPSKSDDEANVIGNIAQLNMKEWIKNDRPMSGPIYDAVRPQRPQSVLDRKKRD